MDDRPGDVTGTWPAWPGYRQAGPGRESVIGIYGLWFGRDFWAFPIFYRLHPI